MKKATLFNAAPAFAGMTMLIVSVLLLTGCAATKSLFGGDKAEERLPGERYTILELQEELEPDPVLKSSRISLPAPWNNDYWPQFAGYANHAMGHVALRPDIEQAWSADIGEGGSESRPLFMPPIVADHMVYTLDTGLLVSAFDAATGKRQWKTKLPVEDYAHGSVLGGGLAFAGGKLYVTTGLPKLYVLNPVTGGMIATIDLSSAARTAPSVFDGRVYVQTLDNRLTAYSTEDYKPVWSYAGLNETTSLLGGAPPAVDRDIIVAAFSSGELVALRNLNGQSLWMDNLAAVRPAGALASISEIKGAVVLDKGLAYAVSYNGRMAAIDILSGRRVWQRKISGAQTPYAVGNVVYVITSDRELVALSRVDGRIYWVAPLPEGETAKSAIWYGPVLAGGRLLTVSATGVMHEYDPITGQMLKSRQLDDAPAGAPVVAGNTLYVVMNNGTLAAYR